MTQRRYGPEKGAGTTVTELEGSKQIVPGALGFAGYAGMFEKGPVGELVIVRTKKEFNKVMGSYYPGTLAPDNCEDYFEIARGAGGLCLVRVTDGNELQAQSTLFTRNGDLRESMGVLKAHNGGKWGGKSLKFRGDMPTDVATDLTNTTLTTGETGWATDQLKGGYVELIGVPNAQYEIASNTDTGVITVLDGYTMLDDMDASTETGFYVVLANGSKYVAFTVGDGEDNPDTEFSITAIVDGIEVRKWLNLNTDPLSPNYWVSAINDDEFNYYLEAVDGWDGKPHTPGARPANYYGKVAAVTQTVLTTELMDVYVSNSTGPITALTVTEGTTTDEMVEQTLTCTVLAGDLTFDVVSDVFGTIGAGAFSFDVAITPDNKFVPAFTLGATGAAEGDVFVIHYKPFIADALIGGFVFPDKVNASTTKFRITDNDHKTISIASGYDMTAVSEIDDYFQVEAPTQMSGGRDGNADVSDTEFINQAWDIDNSPFNKTNGKNLGVLKFATPGWDGVAGLTSAVDTAGKDYAETKNHMYRAEIPIAIVEDNEAIAHINNTVGRSDFLVASFPSWGYIMDPEAPGTNKLKLVSLTGMIHGREAAIARLWKGYHKAAAGVDATLPKIKKLTTGTDEPDHELHNPAGLSIIIMKQGNYVVWGDRTCYTDPNWKWKHQRELMSYYEHVLQESYDWIIFAINDPENDSVAYLSLQEYFRPEWRKRAIRGASLADAAIIKIDDENNTDATRAEGDLNAEIQLRLADTVERFNIFIGKQGIFESVG